jgi:hypothetical protein
MSIEFSIERAFRKKQDRGWGQWPRMYWAIDLHDVIIPGTYTKNNEDRKLYPDAKEVLQWLSKRVDMCMILWTASHPEPTNDIVNWLRDEHGVAIDHIGKNPECPSNALCDFTNKFYFDILLEDKAGFDGMNDWPKIKKMLIKLGEWDKKISHEEKLPEKKTSLV